MLSQLHTQGLKPKTPKHRASQETKNRILLNIVSSNFFVKLTQYLGLLSVQVWDNYMVSHCRMPKKEEGMKFGLSLVLRLTLEFNPRIQN